MQKNKPGKAVPTARERLYKFESTLVPVASCRLLGSDHRFFGQCQFYRSITQSRLRLSLARCSTRTKTRRHNDAPLPPTISPSRSDALKAAGGALAYNDLSRIVKDGGARLDDLDQRWWGGTVMGELFKILFAFANHYPERASWEYSARIVEKLLPAV